MTLFEFTNPGVSNELALRLSVPWAHGFPFWIKLL